LSQDILEGMNASVGGVAGDQAGTTEVDSYKKR